MPVIEKITGAVSRLSWRIACLAALGVFALVAGVALVASGVFAPPITRILTTGGALRVVLGVAFIGGSTAFLHLLAWRNFDYLLDRAAERTAECEDRYRGLVDNMADAMLAMGSDGRIIFTNPRAHTLTGRSGPQLSAMSLEDIVPMPARQRIAQRASAAMEAGVSDSYETEVLHASGKAVPVEVTVSAGKDERGEPIVQWVARDITERKRFEAELVHLADHDYLTGLYNKRRFEEELRLTLERSRRTGQTGAVLWLDIDFFKEVNDAFGHKAGDDLIVGIGSRLSQLLRAGSMLARLGGDEFAVLLQDADGVIAENTARRLLEEIRAALFLVKDSEVRITSSIGVVVFPDHGTTVEELLARADAALYRAKESRDCYRVYYPEEQWPEELRARFDWEATIQRALAEDRFEIHAQPIIRIADGTIDRYELFIRMIDEDGDLVAPESFLGVAERGGLIGRIDRWMVKHAVALIAGRPAGERPPRLDVNLSGKALSDAGLLDVIEAELERTGIDPLLLGIEITETAAVVDIAKARAFIERLKSLGCRVSLDDFGSGFSSFYYLNNLPVDCLKIDGSFIMHLLDSRRDQHTVRAIVELSEGFGIESVAEYVENDETLAMLHRFGVCYAQGYGIGRPQTVADWPTALVDKVPARAVETVESAWSLQGTRSP